MKRTHLIKMSVDPVNLRPRRRGLREARYKVSYPNSVVSLLSTRLSSLDHSSENKDILFFSKVVKSNGMLVTSFYK